MAWTLTHTKIHSPRSTIYLNEWAVLTLPPSYHNPLKTISLETDKEEPAYSNRNYRDSSEILLRNNRLHKSIISGVASSIFTHEIWMSRGQWIPATISITAKHCGYKRVLCGLPQLPARSARRWGTATIRISSNPRFDRWTIQLEVSCRIFTVHPHEIVVSAGDIRDALKGSAFWITHPIATDLRNNSFFYMSVLLAAAWEENNV